MYQINNLKREVLITPDEVVFHSPADQQIDEKSIRPNIILAEERFISNMIGNNFYEDFITRKNIRVAPENKAFLLEKLNEYYESEGLETIEGHELKTGMIVNSIEFITDEWYKKLWYRYLWKLTAECVEVMMIVPTWLRSTADGQMLNSPQVFGGNNGKAGSGTAKDVQLKLTTGIQDRITPLADRMRLWLCQNRNHFPMFRGDCSGCGCQEDNIKNDGISYIGKSNIITGIYDD